jgi:hypothetical protein
MFIVCVSVCVFLCLCTGRGLATSWSPVQGVLPTVPNQETEPYAPKAVASSQVWEQRRRRKKLAKITNYESPCYTTFSSPLLPVPSEVEMFSTGICPQTPLIPRPTCVCVRACAHADNWETKSNRRTERRKFYFWDITSCSLLKVNRISGTYRLHLQGRRILLPASLWFLIWFILRL